MERAMCPFCGCELWPEALMYRCWCCNKKYAPSEVISFSQLVPGCTVTTGDRASRENDDRELSL